MRAPRRRRCRRRPGRDRGDDQRPGRLPRATGAEQSAAPGRVGERLLGLLGQEVPAERRPALNTAMHLIYGSSWGAPYGLLARRPGPAGGLGFGAALWAASRAELPALSVSPPPWKQPPAVLATDLGFHLVFGFATAAAFEALNT